MEKDETPQLVEQSQSLLLVGEGVSFLTTEHRELLGRIASTFLGGKAVEVAVTTELEPVGYTYAETLESVPINRDELRQFALDNGYTKQRANAAWRTLTEVSKPTELQRKLWGRHVPSTRFLEPLAAKARPVDLRSVHNRLEATELNPRYWPGITDGTLHFLAHLVGQKLGH